MTFKDIIGQEHIVRHMRGALKLGKVSHAYIIAGDDGSGKMMLAKTFAAAIQCEGHGTDPCMECLSCKRFFSGNHPDVRYVTHEKPKTIGVDDIREQLVADVTIKPYSSPKKIYIVDEAEKMNEAAQNALLKTFEEPPEYAVIILLVNNANVMLQTIRSRSIILNVRSVPKKKIADHLVSQKGISPYLAEIAAAFSDGVVGRAEAYACSEEFAEFRTESIGQIARIDSADAGELYKLAKEVSEDKTAIEAKITLFEMWYRDLMVLKATDDPENVLFKEDTAELFRQSELFTYEDLAKKCDALLRFQNRIRQNVNVENALMVLFLALRDKT